jgi:hypothetical protein
VATIPLNRGRSPWNLARSYVSGLPLGIWRNRSDHMHEAVDRTLRSNEFDCVFIDHWLMAQYLPKGLPGLTLLHEHNAEYVMWERQAELERNPLLRPLVRLEAARAAATKRGSCGRSTRYSPSPMRTVGRSWLLARSRPGCVYYPISQTPACSTVRR